MHSRHVSRCAPRMDRHTSFLYVLSGWTDTSSLYAPWMETNTQTSTPCSFGRLSLLHGPRITAMHRTMTVRARLRLQIYHPIVLQTQQNRFYMRTPNMSIYIAAHYTAGRCKALLSAVCRVCASAAAVVDVVASLTT